MKDASFATQVPPGGLQSTQFSPSAARCFAHVNGGVEVELTNDKAALRYPKG